MYEIIVQMDDGNRYRETGLSIVDEGGIVKENEAFWEEARKDLTPKQRKWVHYFIIANLSIKETIEIMEIENVLADPVKSWAREVRKKLRGNGVRKRLEELM